VTCQANGFELAPCDMFSALSAHAYAAVS